ncbi:unnamed protein product [Microthlaspi erraticum]|uniref:Glabrous enhancer-binding protein-like DBD domain-containing protein n=1 Tax=Microthlaspi erraticum TaxID=1685480 RepID=A0A6D2J5Q5_9BRAS|nr:unnamed protein product [Microthlaspi erraticum]
MAPIQAEKIEKPLVSSSSEEEESSSSSESSGEESSSDDDGEMLSKLTQKSLAPVAAEKPESDSEMSGSESDSDSDAEPAEKKTTKPLNTVPTKKNPETPESDSVSESESDSDSDAEPVEKKTTTKPLNSVPTKTKPVTSGSAVALPESSTAKRSLKQTEEAAKKKMKMTSTAEHVKKKAAAATDEKVKKKISGDEAKKMFQRLFSETDEVAMLQGVLDFKSTRGDPYEKTNDFCVYIKPLIGFNATTSQITTKLQRSKKKFLNMVKNSLKKGKAEDEITFSKDVDQHFFDLSRKIWGADGIFPANPRKKSPPHASQSHVVNTHLSSSSREIALFFKAENPSVVSLDESRIAAAWDLVEDGPKKREMEEKMEKLKAMKAELCLQRSGLVDSTARMVFKEN